MDSKTGALAYGATLVMEYASLGLYLGSKTLMCALGVDNGADLESLVSPEIHCWFQGLSITFGGIISSEKPKGFGSYFGKKYSEQ